MEGLWFIGGRRLPGETMLESMNRCFKRETSLNINQARFEFVHQNEYMWKDRQQVPQEAGSHNKADTFCVELTESELMIARRWLDRAEYEPGFGLQEFDRAKLIEHGAHEAIVDLYDAIFS